MIILNLCALNADCGAHRVSRPGPRPHTWLVGPDPQRHEQYTAWHLNRAQARFRNEPWALTFEQYEQLWQGLWHRRGRGTNDLLMMRFDWHGAWDEHNAIIADRGYYTWQLALIKLERGIIRQVRCQPGQIYRGRCA